MAKRRCELMEWAWSLRLMVDSNKKLRPCCVMRWWIPQGNLGSIRGRGARSSLFLFIVQQLRRGDDDVGRPPLSSALSIFDCCRAQLKGRRREGAQWPPYSVPRIYISHLLVPFPYSRGIWRKISINPLPPRKRKIVPACQPIISCIRCQRPSNSKVDAKKKLKRKIWNSYETMR